MQENKGFIKLHRSLLDWRWYGDANVARIFIHILLHASFKEYSVGMVDLKAGQLITGRRALAEALNLTENQIRTGLKKLVQTKEISIKTTSKYSIITVLKWAEYQKGENFFTNDSPTDNRQATNYSPHNKNKNNINNGNKYYPRGRGRSREKSFKEAYKIDEEILNAIINNDL